MKLQEIVDQLAETLGRSVVVNDLDYRPIVATVQEEDIDPMRAEALLRRGTPAPIRDYLESLRVRQLTQPTAISLSPFGGRERLAVPVRSDSATIAVLWLITGGHPPLKGADYAAIDAATALIGQILEGEMRRDGAPSGLVPADLLSADDALSREAFRKAVERRWFVPGPDTVLIAVRGVDEFSDLDMRAVIARLSSLRHPRLVVPGVFGGALVVVAHEDQREAALAAVEEACRAGANSRIWTGSAAVSDEEVRLLPAAERAVLAARIAGRLSDTGGHGDIADLRMWALLDSVTADPSRFGLFSPAALALRTGDATQRETVETYLDVAGNPRAACERLHIHRTTLYYRLDNLPDVVKAALEDGPARSVLHLCLKLDRYHAPGRRVSA